MIYIRNLFTQDLRDGKQIAFPTEPSNLLFKFSFSNQDPERKISFKFKVKDNTSPNFLHNDKIINTRLYSAGSESRIDGELKQFLRDILNAEVDDVIVFRAMSLVSYEFEFIPKGTILYPGYKAILNGKNHEIVLEQDNNEHIEHKTTSQTTNIDLGKLKEDFATWFIKLDEIKHNYYSDSFGSSRDKLLEQLTKYDNLYKEQFGTSIFNLEGKDSTLFINELERNLYLEDGAFFQFSLKTSTHMPRAILGKKNYLKFLKELLAEVKIPQINFNLSSFQSKAGEAGLIFSPQLIQRFVASLCTKPFVICSGLSGSGKTKLAQAFVQWICESEKQYKIIPVGADWTNREPLLGYPNGLDPKSYVTPDSGALQLILEASKEENQNKPYFMILDEMNLSHVERYFADFLSIMESKEKLKLYSGEKRYTQYTKEYEFDEEYFIPYEIEWPKNLFIIGTVNIDETTYMFSPKVLDRANVIEFRITPKEMGDFFKDRKELKMESLFIENDKNKGGVGQSMGEDFFKLAEDKTIIKIGEIEGDDNILNKFFAELQIVGSEFGYRSAAEIELLITKLGNDKFVESDGKPIENNAKIDIAIMQKLLPKLHGSRKKLVGPLETLAGFCLERRKDAPVLDEQNKTKTLYQQFISEKRDSAKWEIKYSISFEKIERMLKNVIENGFTSYAEA
jgi:5-methylcytosine-specific restriction protein B